MKPVPPILPFVKMEGCGNDYVLVDAGLTAAGVDPASLDPLDDLARRVSDRHYGVGSDGLILMLPGRDAPVRMRIFNADGSEAELCLNGLRCVASYAARALPGAGEAFTVETGAGPRPVRVRVQDEHHAEVEVQVGGAGLPAEGSAEKAAPARPVAGEAVAPGVPAVREERFPEMGLSGYAIDVGNPHLVLWRDNAAAVDAADLAVLGPRLEKDPRFPARTNVHWVARTASGALHMRSWERGSGITLACGSGAVAVFRVARALGKAAPRVVVQMPGGDVRLREEPDGSIFLTGPAREVFRGSWPLGARR